MELYDIGKSINQYVLHKCFVYLHCIHKVNILLFISFIMMGKIEPPGCKQGEGR
jgi:hypothetical protein